MNTTTKTLLPTLLAALLASLPVTAAEPDGSADGPDAEDGPCQTFEYKLDPPSYRLRPECIPLPASLPLPTPR